MRHSTNNTENSLNSNVMFIDRRAFVVREREFLFRMGDQLEGIYKVNSGCVKVFRSNEHGDMQIIGFYMAGDLIGLDALADGNSHSTALILETSNISLIPFHSILEKDDKFDSHAFVHQIGHNHNHENDHTMMLSQTADRRLAWFLVNFSDSLAERGMLANKFKIPMTGTDIALYLGMALETLSREVRGFCKQGLMCKNNRDIELLDIEGLRKIACGDDCNEESTTWKSSANPDSRHKQSVHSH